MNKRWWKIKQSLLEAVAANSCKCLGCGADVFDELGFCKSCLKEVNFNNGKTCKICGVALHGAEDYCGHCAFEKTYYDRCFSPFCYGGAAQKAILDMKFHNVASNAKILAKFLVFAAQCNNVQFDLVTFVPMTKTAQKRRGYNQAQLLAQHFCDILQIDFPVAALKKIKETSPQEKLSKQARQENLIGAFVAEPFVKGKRVLVVDDIKTTGATLNECAKALKRRGALQVFCLTVASREETTAWEIVEEV